MARRANPNTKLAGEFIRLVRLNPEGEKEVVEGIIRRFECNALIVMVDGLDHPVRVGGPNGYIPIQIGTPNMECRKTIVLRSTAETEKADSSPVFEEPINVEEVEPEYVDTTNKEKDFDLDSFREDSACPDEERENELAFLDPFGTGIGNDGLTLSIEEI